MVGTVAKKNKKHDRHQKNIIIAISVLLVVLSIFAFWKIAPAVILAGTVAIVLKPVADKVFRKYKSKRIASLAGTSVAIILFFMLVLLPLTIVLANYSALIDLFNGFTDTLSQVDQKVSISFIDISNISQNAKAWLTNGIVDFATSIHWYVFLVIVFFIALYTFLFYSWDIGDKVGQLGNTHPEIKLLIGRLYQASFDILYTLYVVFIALAIITFFLAIPFFWVLGYSDFLLYSLLAALFQLLPFLGPSLIMAIVFIHQYILGDVLGMILTVVVGYFIVSALPDIYIRPKLLGKKAEMGWTVMFIAVFGGILIMGPWGFIFGPLILSLTKTSYDTLIDIYTDE